MNKMRNANPLTGEKEDLDEETSDPQIKKKVQKEQKTDDKEELVLEPIPNLHASIDPSDPNTTIRKLLKHIEILTVRLWSFFELVIMI